MRRPKKVSNDELKKVGVKIISRHTVLLECESCGQRWAPNIQGEGRMPRGYWKCPNGCNEW
jgi:hypothetical protein